ncbi:MAG TPA: sortase [Dehalococcoidia bacterium]|nr:sortase [Dehalococcoidia bacterium]
MSSRAWRKVGFSLIVVGSLLLVLAGGYYIYASIAQARLNELIVKPTPSPGPTSAAPETPTPHLTPVESPTPTQTPETPPPTPSPVETLAPTPGPTSTATETATPPLTLVESPTPMPTSTQTSTPASAPTPTLTPTQPALPPPVRIYIPTLSIDAPVVEVGLTQQGEFVSFVEPPKDTVGHYSGSPNPGMPGNVVMYGHKSSLFGGSVFRNLLNIHLGDEIIIENELKDRFVYEVIEPRIPEGTELLGVAKSGAWILVNPDEARVLSPSEEPILTLITCEPEGWYTMRLVVTAKLVFP